MEFALHHDGRVNFMMEMSDQKSLFVCLSARDFNMFLLSFKKVEKERVRGLLYN